MKKIKTIIGFLSVLFACAVVFTSCAGASLSNINALTDQELNANAAEVDMGSVITYSFDNVMQMRKFVPGQNTASVLLKGYYYTTDGGGGMFYWDGESTLEHDGGIVIAPNNAEKGRYIRICESDYRNVKWFGAVGSGSNNDTDAIRKAIASLPPSGGTVYFPGGTYCINDTINIGNGDGEGVRSEYNGIKLIGCGCSIRATRDIDVMISINGRICDVVIDGIDIYANQLAKTCILARAVNSLRVSNLAVSMFTECGLHLIGGKTNGSGNVNCTFESVNSVSIVNNVICVLIDGDGTNCPTENCRFIDSRFDVHTTAGSMATLIRNAHAIEFYRCHFAGYNDEESEYLVLEATADGSPYGITYYDCSVKRIKIIEENGNSIGDSFFYGYGTYDLEDTPDHPRLHGITDSGMPFNLGG